MKLIGRDVLLDLIAADQSISGSVSAWAGEAEHAHWKSDADIRRVFPNAELQVVSRVIIPLNAVHCVKFAIDYGSELLLIEYAGPRSALPARAKKSRGRAA